MKIDIVYLWVDSADTKWRSLKNKWETIEFFSSNTKG